MISDPALLQIAQSNSEISRFEEVMSPMCQRYQRHIEALSPMSIACLIQSQVVNVPNPGAVDQLVGQLDLHNARLG